MSHDQDPLDRELTELLRAYREACPDPGLTAGFMPQLWERIEAQQSYARYLKRLARGLVTAAAAVSLLMGIVLFRWEPPVNFYTDTYVEVLAQEQGTEAEIVPISQGTF